MSKKSIKIVVDKNISKTVKVPKTIKSTKFILTGVYLSNFVKETSLNTNVITGDISEENVTTVERDLDDLNELYTTNVNDIIKEKSKKYITYIDPNKSKIKLWCSMYDIVQQIFLPLTTEVPCWWCREEFKTMPIGIPLHYHVKNTKNQAKFQNLFSGNEEYNTIEDFFETEGVFCSFPCCKAFIIENSPKCYSNSTTLLTLLYYKIYGKLINIEQAPSWKILTKWGGHLSIEEFRSSFQQIEYLTTPNFKRPFMCATGSFIEELVK